MKTKKYPAPKIKPLTRKMPFLYTIDVKKQAIENILRYCDESIRRNNGIQNKWI